MNKETLFFHKILFIFSHNSSFGYLWVQQNKSYKKFLHRGKPFSRVCNDMWNVSFSEINGLNLIISLRKKKVATWMQQYWTSEIIVHVSLSLNKSNKLVLLVYNLNISLTLSLPGSVIETFTVILAFEYVVEILRCDHQMKPHQQYFHMVLFIFKNFTKWNLRFVLNFDLRHSWEC